MPYLTGSPPDGECTLQIILPGADAIRRAAAGALLDLTLAYNWEYFGEATPEEYAAACLALFDTFTFTCSILLLDDSADFLLDDSAQALLVS